MTLEEAIKQSEDIADANERIADIYKNNDKDFEEARRSTTEYYRQLAEWLKELKKWRALRDSINMLCDVDCEYPQYRERGTMCDACPIGTVKDYFEQIFDGEVNADGDSD
jgi:predicted O-linked N-acetylglucosamine transferase (SPINDLY family)